MSKTLKFPENRQYQAFHQDLLMQAQHFFEDNNIGRNANIAFWLKAAFWFSSTFFFYIVLYFLQSKFLFCLCYFLFAWSLFLFNLNVAHDAAHYSIFRKKKLNHILYNFCFFLMGNSAYIWQKNHCSEHHAMPNVIGKDPDVIETPLLRFYPLQKKRFFHRFQFLYAPLLYLLHAPVYFFLTEPRILLSYRSDQNFTVGKRLWALSGKIFFISVAVIIPGIITDFSIPFLLLLFILIQMSYSLFLVFGLGISHLNDYALFSEVDQQENCSENYVKVQLFASADYNSNCSFTHFLMGGFNTHGLHHIFPGVCHIHYKKLSQLLNDNAQKHNIPYKSYTYQDLLKSHFRLLIYLSK